MSGMSAAGGGPLSGYRIVELGGIGPVQFVGMVLADLGADVVRIDRAEHPAPPRTGLARGRSYVSVDLSADGSQARILELIENADGAMEGFRPGVAERLGIGPAELLLANPRLVYGRMSGWGRQGPLADAPGHDINYIALSGALSGMRRPGEGPVVTPGYVGDFGGAGMSLAVGMLAAMLESKSSGQGQVVDCSITAGSAWISVAYLDQLNAGPGEAAIATGRAPFYNVYECSDHRYVAVGALEPPFYCAFIELLRLDSTRWSDQFDTSSWPARIEELTRRFAARSRDEWAAHPLAGQACLAPVLEPGEAIEHEQNRLSELFVERSTGPEPNLAPRFSRTAGLAAPYARRETLADTARRWSACNDVANPKGAWE